MNPDLLGWVASLVLLATLIRQIYVQAQDKGAPGVSRWLFIGQSVASVGFIAYAWMVDSLVFIVTNSAILLTALIGQWIVFRRNRGI